MQKQSSLFLSLQVEIYRFIWGSCLDKVSFLSSYSPWYFFDNFAYSKYKNWDLFWFCSEHWDVGFTEVKYWKSSRFQQKAKLIMSLIIVPFNFSLFSSSLHEENAPE